MLKRVSRISSNAQMSTDVVRFEGKFCQGTG